MHFYAVSVLGGTEYAVAECLKTWGVQARVPSVTRSIRLRHTRKPKEVGRPAIPGYVFAPILGCQWPLLRRLSAVLGVICVDGQPARLDAHAMSRLDEIVAELQAAEHQAQAGPVRTTVRFGDLVTVVGTAFDGWKGVVANANHERGDLVRVDLGPRIVAIPLDALRVAA